MLTLMLPLQVTLLAAHLSANSGLLQVLAATAELKTGDQNFHTAAIHSLPSLWDKSPPPSADSQAHGILWTLFFRGAVVDLVESAGSVRVLFYNPFADAALLQHYDASASVARHTRSVMLAGEFVRRQPLSGGAVSWTQRADPIAALKENLTETLLQFRRDETIYRDATTGSEQHHIGVRLARLATGIARIDSDALRDTFESAAAQNPNISRSNLQEGAIAFAKQVTEHRTSLGIVCSLDDGADKAIIFIAPTMTPRSQALLTLQRTATGYNLLSLQFVKL
mgnify:CR=1 FL=1